LAERIAVPRDGQRSRRDDERQTGSGRSPVPCRPPSVVVYARDRDAKAVSFAGTSYDKRRGAVHLAQRRAHLPDAHVQSVLEVHVDPIAPNRVTQRFVRHYLATLDDKQGQGAERLWADTHRLALFAEHASADVELEDRERPPSRV